MSEVDLQKIFGGRPRAAVAHPMLGRGGSETSLMWLVEALKRDCEVTVVTTKGWDLEQLNKFCGTRVQPGEVNVRLVPTLLPERVSAAALRGAIYQRFLQEIADAYDVRISAYNPADWGAPAIHRLADFSWHQAIKEEFDTRGAGWIHSDTILRKAYLRLCRRCGRSTGRDLLKQDILVANSEWSAAVLRKSGAEKEIPVVYPPAWQQFPELPWLQKELSFVMIGRIAREKRIECAISVLKAVRLRGHEIRLHLCGSIHTDEYGRQIEALCDANRDWISAEGVVTGTRKAELLSRCRYGLMFGSREAFGIATAEMARAGAIVFAPSFGGQAEIINDERLLFDCEAEAINKIDIVLRSKELQAELRTHLATTTRRFTPERYMRQWRAIVANYLAAADGWKQS